MTIKTLAMSIALRKTMIEEMTRDERIFLLGEDITEYGGAFGVSRGMLKTFGPSRIINTPISENSFIGVALGAALMGQRPIVELMFMDFLTLAMDQLVTHATKFHYMYGGQVTAPMVIRAPFGGGKGYGATHSQSLESWLLNVPGLKVVAPAFPSDARGLLKSTIADDNPVFFLEHKLLYHYKDGVDMDVDETVPIGKARIVRQGTDITLIIWRKYPIKKTLSTLIQGPLQLGVVHQICTDSNHHFFRFLYVFEGHDAPSPPVRQRGNTPPSVAPKSWIRTFPIESWLTISLTQIQPTTSWTP